MPVTPFHFGPALLVKAATPRYLSMVAFGVSQIVIDCETAYNVIHGRWPLHRDLHTLAGATVVGLLSGLSVIPVCRLLRKSGEATIAGIPGELGMTPCLIGGLFGGVSHSILDAIMHADVEPFAPAMTGNPVHGFVSLLALHVFLLLAGLIGAIWLWRRRLPAAPRDGA